MMGITLWQPWAAAVCRGFKAVETRHWASPYLGPVAIHAAKKWTRSEREAAARLGLALAGDEGYFTDLSQAANFRGGIVAVANLVDSVRMTPDMVARVQDPERMCGGWEVGRYAWRLADVRPLRDPYPMTGRQGFWRLSAPEEEAVRLLAGEPLTLPGSPLGPPPQAKPTQERIDWEGKRG